MTCSTPTVAVRLTLLLVNLSFYRCPVSMRSIGCRNDCRQQIHWSAGGRVVAWHHHVGLYLIMHVSLRSYCDSYALVCGTLPFDDDLETVVHQKIQNVDYQLPAHLSEACRELIASILQKDAAARPTVDQILQHTWLQSNVEPVSEVLPPREEGSKEITLKRQTVKPDLAILTTLSSTNDESASPLSALTPFLANNDSTSLSQSSSSSSLLSPVSTPTMGSQKRAAHAKAHKLLPQIFQ